MKGISVITEDRNLFIWVLEYGERNISRRISSDEMLNTAVDEGLINSHSEPKAEVLRKIFYECFNIEKLRSQYSHAPQVLQQMSSSLMTEYYFRLIEYRELQLARENAELARENSVLARKHAETATLLSNRAWWTSIGAIAISVVLSFGVAWWQITNPVSLSADNLKVLQPVNQVSIDKKQLNELLKSNNNTAIALKGYLDSLEKTLRELNALKASE